MRAVVLVVVALVLMLPQTAECREFGLLRWKQSCVQNKKPYRDRKNPPKHYNYPDKHDYGFDPVPPNFRIAPGFRPNHWWRGGAWWYGQGDYSPGYDGMLWFGYEIEY